LLSLDFSSFITSSSTPLFSFLFFFQSSAAHRDLHSFPTRRSSDLRDRRRLHVRCARDGPVVGRLQQGHRREDQLPVGRLRCRHRSEEHTSELQSLAYLVCRLLLEKKKKKNITRNKQ